MQLSESAVWPARSQCGIAQYRTGWCPALPEACQTPLFPEPVVMIRTLCRYIHVKRDEEGRKREASKVEQTIKQSNTTHPRQSHFQRKMSCLRWDSTPRHSACTCMMVVYSAYSCGHQSKGSLCHTNHSHAVVNPPWTQSALYKYMYTHIQFNSLPQASTNKNLDEGHI